MPKSMAISAATILAIGVSAPAAGSMRLDAEQCTPIYSVQKSMCAVEHIHRCDIPDGTFFRHEEIEEGDADFVDIYTEDYDQVAAYEEDGPDFLIEITENRDPFSLSNLLATGEDLTDQTAETQLPIFVDALPGELRMAARLLGRTETISGIELERGVSVPTIKLVGTAFEASGRENLFIDRTAGVIIRGETTISIGGNSTVESGDPVQILKPGDAFFMLDIPLFGCGDEALLPLTGRIPT